MKFSVLTYNVLFNKAFLRLEKILNKYKPDILCFQEVDTSEYNLTLLEKYGYTLADYSNSLIKSGKVYGLATYYNQKKVSLIESDSFDLPKSFYELFVTAIKLLKGGSKARTILRTDFQFRGSEKKIAVYNVHLTLLGMNRMRKKQLQKVLDHGTTDRKLPILITGDFNYAPYRRRSLEELMNEYGFEEATKGLYFTMRQISKKYADYSFLQELGAKLAYKFFRLKPDYTFSKNIKTVKTTRIDARFSDHYPIVSLFELD